MKPSRQSTVLVIAAMLVASLPHLMAMPAVMVLAVLAAAGWRLSVEFRHSRRPGWIARLLLTLLGLSLVIVNFGTLGGRRAATALLCIMLALKLTEMFRIRDARVVATLGYFLVATQFLFDQRLEMLAYLLAACWLITVALIRLQRDSDDVPAAQGQHNPGMPTGELLRAGAMLTAFAIPFAVVVFLLFPRLSTPLWGMPDTTVGRSGLSDEMSPGRISSLFLDNSPAFRAQFDSTPPPRNQLYWRGPVLWDFDGRSWKGSLFMQREPRRLPAMSPAAFSYQVQMEPSDRNWLFALDYPARWPEDTRLTADFELRRNSPVTSVTAYRVTSQPDFVDTPRLPSGQRRAALALPFDSNPRTREHAARLRQQHPDDAGLIAAVLRWFNQEEFFYSLQTSPLGRHGADEFLFDLRNGYCEYYASAFAVLMRAAGIPARIVTGYQGGLWQAADEYLLVRQSDAHAWVEVWLPERGWTRVDPTAAVAPNRIESGARDALPDVRGWRDADWLWQLRNQYDRLQHFWNRQVLAFDFARQQRLLTRLGLGGISGPLQALLLVVLAMLVIAPLALLLRTLVRQHAPDSLVDRLWARVRRKLARAGIPNRASESPLELAERARPLLHNGHELITLATQYCLLKYGPLNETDDDAVEFSNRAGHFRPLRVN
ncbi:MAG: transglutaminaseTgpA domain-containing protein [Wenzhouxiangellaceae bacterium]